MRRWRLLIHLRSSLWFIPVLCVVAGTGVAIGTIAVDRAFDYNALPTSVVGGPDAAEAILSTVAASMVSLTALVLTITMVVVQLAMGQFSPRIVRRILQDKPSQVAIGLFVGTFVVAILALREVTNNGDGTGHVPGVAVMTSFLLVLASIAVLVIYVQHIGQSLRVSALIELVGNDTRGLIDQLYPDKGRPCADSPDEAPVVRAAISGVITGIGYERIVEEARVADCELELVPALGDFVPAGGVLFRISGNSDKLDHGRVRSALLVKSERTLDRDVAYGVRLLVDIAERSLAESPFVDPTTAVQAIDRLHDILRQLAKRPFPDGRYCDPTGRLRLVVKTMSWDAYVLLATEEIRLAGAGSPQVTRRLKAMLTDLRSIAPPERWHVIDRQLAALATAANSELQTHEDIEFALIDDPKGIGSAAG
jgi:uncharacterized membrane protein